MSERSSTPSTPTLAALTLSAALDDLPQDVLVSVFLACDTTSVCRLASTCTTLARCCEAGRVWEAVWHRQFGGIWELDYEDPAITVPTHAEATSKAACKPNQQLDAHTAATKARSWLRKAATCRHHLIDQELAFREALRKVNVTYDMVIFDPTIKYNDKYACSSAYRWMGLFDDRGHLCHCPHCKRPFAVTVKTGFRDTEQFSSTMVLDASFRPIKEAPARDSFEVVWYSVEAQTAVKRAMRDATRWPDGVCEVDADGKSVHAKSGFSGGPAAVAAPTAGTWANWPDAQN